MERQPTDEEAPKDPGAQATLQNFSEKDFDSKHINTIDIHPEMKPSFVPNWIVVTPKRPKSLETNFVSEPQLSPTKMYRPFGLLHYVEC